VTQTNSILRRLNAILRPYFPDKEARLNLIKTLLTQFENSSFLKYPLPDNHFLILSKTERKLKSLRRYEESPFPLLSNMENFSNNVGRWNEELLAYGIKTREKLNDLSNNTSRVGSQIHLINYKTLNSKGNQYLKRQYKRLSVLRKSNRITAYWNLSWTLMCSSWSYRIASLCSWKSNWVTLFTGREINQLFKELNKILNLQQLQTLITNVWIESPKGKWRQLGIPPKSWRLYFHMLNQFLSYIYSPHLDPSIYDGFLYNRGCKSWWSNLIWNNYLTKFPNIIEFDFSSGFPNISRYILRQALISDQLLPENLINLILLYLQSPLKESAHFPTYESYVENKYNRNWRTGSRSVHMGLGISPILFVITVHWVFRQLNLYKISGLSLKSYADDWSVYFTYEGLNSLIRSTGSTWLHVLLGLTQNQNVLLTIFNSHPLFKEAGLILCSKKSGWVRIFHLWLKPYQSLGLKLTTSLPLWKQFLLTIIRQEIPLDLSGSTRGRGPNPSKNQPGTEGSKILLNFPSERPGDSLNYSVMKSKYKQYFGLIQSKLYSSPPLPSLYLPNTSSSTSSLSQELRKELSYKSSKPLRAIYNQYNLCCKLNELILKINNKELIPLEWKIIYPNHRELKIPWNIRNTDLSSHTIPNPLPPVESIPLTDYFTKYSEITQKLTNHELETLKVEYEKLKV